MFSLALVSQKAGMFFKFGSVVPFHKLIYKASRNAVPHLIPSELPIDADVEINAFGFIRLYNVP